MTLAQVAEALYQSLQNVPNFNGQPEPWRFAAQQALDQYVGLTRTPVGPGPQAGPHP